jgi:Ni,Fe-hydrogenase III component G
MDGEAAATEELFVPSRYRSRTSPKLTSIARYMPIAGSSRSEVRSLFGWQPLDGQ